MAATVDVREGNGVSPGTWTIVTAAKFCTADNYNPGTANPIPIVTGQTKRSFWKNHELRLSGTYTEISNIKIYTDGGGFGTGITTYAGNECPTPAQYEQATGTVGDTGNELVATHTIITAKTDLFTYTSAAPKDVDAGPYSTPPESTKHVCLQMDVADTASPGELTAESIVFRYDEV